MEILPSSQLPEITADAQSLVDAAEKFFFNGIPSDLLHMFVRRENGYFDGEKLVPVEDYAPYMRTQSTAIMIDESIRHILKESYTTGETTISNPQAYIDLIRAGEKVLFYRKKYGYSVDASSSEIDPYIVAVLAYETFNREFMTGTDMGYGWYFLERLRPIYKPGESILS